MTNHLKAHALSLKYPSELLEPIRPIAKRRGLLGGFLSQEAQEEELENHVHDQRISRLLLLFKHYGLEGKDLAADFRKLSIHLLEDWVPGFSFVNKPAPRRGAPKLGDENALVQLANELDRILELMPNKSLKVACGTYLDRHKHEPRWRVKSSGRAKSLRTVENRYRDGCVLRQKRHLFLDQAGLIGGSYRGGLFVLGEAAIRSGLLDPARPPKKR